MVRQRSAKPLFSGSNPDAASTKPPNFQPETSVLRCRAPSKGSTLVCPSHLCAQLTGIAAYEMSLHHGGFIFVYRERKRVPLFRWIDRSRDFVGRVQFVERSIWSGHKLDRCLPPGVGNFCLADSPPVRGTMAASPGGIVLSPGMNHLGRVFIHLLHVKCAIPVPSGIPSTGPRA